MMMQHTLSQLRSLKLNGFSDALEHQMNQSSCSGMSFEERLALLVDQEVHHRHAKRQQRLLKKAHLRYGQACIEDVDQQPNRGIDRATLMSLVLSNWIQSGQSILLIGPTGVGKSWLACALAQYACRQGYSALYLRTPRLQEDLVIRHASGTFRNWLMQLAKTDVLILDDWGLGTLGPATRADLLEIIDDRAAQKATIITTQLPIEHWHTWIGDPTIADALLDRIFQKHHRILLKGESLRKPSEVRKTKADTISQKQL